MQEQPHVYIECQMCKHYCLKLSLTLKGNRENSILLQDVASGIFHSQFHCVKFHLVNTVNSQYVSVDNLGIGKLKKLN